MGAEINLNYHKVSPQSGEKYDAVDQAMKDSISKVIADNKGWDIFRASRDPQKKHRLEAELNREIGQMLWGAGVSADGVEITKLQASNQFVGQVGKMDQANLDVEQSKINLETAIKQARDAELAGLKAKCGKEQHVDKASEDDRTAAAPREIMGADWALDLIEFAKAHPDRVTLGSITYPPELTAQIDLELGQNRAAAARRAVMGADAAIWPKVQDPANYSPKE
jgi:hypothetical protein